MRASQTTQAPQPLPLPLPLPPAPLSLPSSPPSAPRRGRHRTSYSSSSSSSSSVSTASSFCPSPSPAPSPRASTSSLVPFSWERHPGIPKNALPVDGGGGSPAGTPLPLPPPLQPPPRRRRRRRHANAVRGPASSDPFVAAFAECTRDDDVDDVDEADHGADDVAVKGKLWLAPTKPAAASGSRWRLAGGGFVGFLDLSGCKSAIAVADGAFVARRPVAVSRSGSGRPTCRR